MSEPVPVELYTGPVRKNMEMPRYPRLAQAKGMEGWVRLDFMVGTDGKAFEIAVTDSMGNPNFRGAAIRALRKSTFEPVQGRVCCHGHPGRSHRGQVALSGELRLLPVRTGLEVPRFQQARTLPP